MSRRRVLTTHDIERAMMAPASLFATPEEVLLHEELSKEQKSEILLRWEYEAAEIAVAVEEGMPGEDDGLLRRIMIALGAIAGPIDLEHTGPTKHHGLSSVAVKRD